MKLKNQVCTLDQAKRLKELGIEQASLYYHVPDVEDKSKMSRAELLEFFKDLLVDAMLKENGGGTIRYSEAKALELAEEFFTDDDMKNSETYYSAFTVAELGVMLPPEFIPGENGNYFINTYRMLDGSLFVVDLQGDDMEFENILSKRSGKTEAEARAEMLIHLLTSGKITAGAINGRLTSDQ